jgi:hypothetical protein
MVRNWLGLIGRSQTHRRGRGDRTWFQDIFLKTIKILVYKYTQIKASVSEFFLKLAMLSIWKY